MLEGFQEVRTQFALYLNNEPGQLAALTGMLVSQPGREVALLNTAQGKCGDETNIFNFVAADSDLAKQILIENGLREGEDFLTTPLYATGILLLTPDLLAWAEEMGQRNILVTSMVNLPQNWLTTSLAVGVDPQDENRALKLLEATYPDVPFKARQIPAYRVSINTQPGGLAAVWRPMARRFLGLWAISLTTCDSYREIDLVPFDDSLDEMPLALEEGRQEAENYANFQWEPFSLLRARVTGEEHGIIHDLATRFAENNINIETLINVPMDNPANNIVRFTGVER